MNLEDRIKRRLLIEDPVMSHDDEIGVELPLCADLWTDNVQMGVAARIAALEAEDTANPLAATAVVRRPLELTLDTAAVLAKFPQEEA